MHDAALHWFNRHGKVVLILAALTAMVPLALSLSRFVQAINHSEPIPQNDEVMQRKPPVPPTPSPDIAEVAGMGWFGHAPDEITSGDAAVQATLEGFELKGISRSADPSLAGAFIAQKGQPESYYHLGDSLPNNAGTLAELFSDHITVRQGPALAVLAFPPEVNTTAAPALEPHPPEHPTNNPANTVR